MEDDRIITRALLTGLKWVTTAVQPAGAALHPMGAVVVVRDWSLTFGVGRDGNARVGVERADRSPLDVAHRLYWQLHVSTAGYGVVGFEGFDGSKWAEVVTATPAHPSVVAAIREHDERPGRSGRPAAVWPDFTRILEAENETLREELRVARSALGVK